jgi:hypothetical protein
MIARIALAASLAGPLVAGAAAAETLKGRIKGFECGDNCYLTIVDARKKEHVGLCVARECAPWNFLAEMPRAFVGVKVTVETGKGAQLDGSGAVAGRMTAFTRLTFEP